MAIVLKGNLIFDRFEKNLEKIEIFCVTLLYIKSENFPFPRFLT